VLTRRSNVSPKHKSCKVRGSSPTPGEAMSAKLAAIHWSGHSIIICATICPPMNPSVNACNARGSQRSSYSGISAVEGQQLTDISAGICPLGPSCVSPTLQLKRE